MFLFFMSNSQQLAFSALQICYFIRSCLRVNVETSVVHFRTLCHVAACAWQMAPLINLWFIAAYYCPFAICNISTDIWINSLILSTPADTCRHRLRTPVLLTKVLVIQKSIEIRPQRALAKNHLFVIRELKTFIFGENSKWEICKLGLLWARII